MHNISVSVEDWKLPNSETPIPGTCSILDLTRATFQRAWRFH